VPRQSGATMPTEVSLCGSSQDLPRFVLSNGWSWISDLAPPIVTGGLLRPVSARDRDSEVGAFVLRQHLAVPPCA